MKTTASAGRIETSENYNTQTPSSNCSESSAEISFSGHSLSGNQGSSTFSQNSATKNSQILGYQPVSKEIKLQIHRFSFLLKATP